VAEPGAVPGGAAGAAAPGHAPAVRRHYGDPAAEYRAATRDAALVERGDRRLLRAWGRDPVRMLQGLVTADLAGAPPGQGVYGAFLTPKGRMVADARLLSRPDGEVWLETDAAAVDGLAAHLHKYVPPLFARFEPLGHVVLGVYGPAAAGIAGRVLGALPARPGEDAYAELAAGGLVVRSGYAGVDGCDAILPAAGVAEAAAGLEAAGARPAGHAALDVLRIEAGRPRWGAELTPDVIPLEAGLRERAISESKGCYTGQEVIIRILHRGHVNRHLRGVLLGELPAPAAGTELFRPGDDRAVGRITSACASPRFEQTIALGYVRREVAPPATLRLGRPDGPAATVVALPFGG
jgi:tRNA-modifying protein YgfZ